MTIIDFLANARRGAARLLAQIKRAHSRDLRVELVEEAAAVSELCRWVESKLAKSASSEDIALGMLHQAGLGMLVKAMRTPGQHMKEHGLRAAVKAVRGAKS